VGGDPRSARLVPRGEDSVHGVNLSGQRLVGPKAQQTHSSAADSESADLPMIAHLLQHADANPCIRIGRAINRSPLTSSATRAVSPIAYVLRNDFGGMLVV
jgi:hypothetical protein